VARRMTVPVQSRWRGFGPTALLLAIAVVLPSLLTAPAASAAARTGTLTVQVNGLPAGLRPLAILSGPGLHRRLRVARLTVRRARPGRYTLRVISITSARAYGNVRKGARAYSAGTGIVSLKLARGRIAHLTGAYGSIVNPGVISLGGGVLGVAGPPTNPRAVTLTGRRALKPGRVLSLPPSARVPRGVLARIAAVRHTGARTVVTLRPVSVFAVVPVAQFDIPLGASGAAAHTAAVPFGKPTRECGPSVSGTEGVYRTVNHPRLSGGWNTVSVLGAGVPVGLNLTFEGDIAAGVKDTDGVELGVSCEVDILFNGMAGPIPVTGVVFGNVHASVVAGAGLQADIGAHVKAEVSTVGVPPTLLWAPRVTFSDPTGNLFATAEASAGAGFGAGVKFGLGNAYLTDATLNVNNDLDFDVPSKASGGGRCSVQAKFASFSAEGKVGAWTVESPSTPPVYTQTWVPSFCKAHTPAPPQAGGGGTGGGTGGGSGSGGGSGGGSALAAVACPALAQCTAVGFKGEEVTFNPRSPGTAVPMTLTGATGAGGVHVVSCPSIIQCTAVVYGGPEVTFNPMSSVGRISSATVGNDAVACSSTGQCTAVGASGQEVTFNPSRSSILSQATLDTNPLVSVGCPSTTQCTALAYGGREFTFNPNSPGTPISVPLTIGGQLSLACPSTTQCTAVDGGGEEVTFDPQSSASPVPTTIDPGQILASIACPATSQCTAVDFGGREVTFNPASPPRNPLPRSIDVVTLWDVGCPSTAQCTAVDAAGQEVTFNPQSLGTPTPILVNRP
jgi:hypothetical protein